MSETSGKWRFNYQDAARWIKNTLIFLSPAFLIYLVTVQAALSDGFSWNDFAITPVVSGAIMGWAVSTVIDFLRKLSAAPKAPEDGIDG